MVEARAVKNEPAVLPGIDEAGMTELLQMERKRCRRHIERVADAAGWQTLRTGFHQQPEDRKARLLRERSKCNHGLLRFHVSIVMETFERVKHRVAMTKPR